MTLVSSPSKIHVIFKTHLDVGFTDFARTVVQNYFTSYIPQAIKLARQMRNSESPERFIWTTGSWLIYDYLEQASGQARRDMEDAITSGDITWHALPFTTHTENMDVPLFRFGLSLSQELDQRFGKQTVAAKMTDVPGHTRGMVPLLAEAGVKFLHIGVNPASTPPDVPPVFVWRDPSGAEIMVMYHKGSYGELMTVPGLKDAISFAHTGDNLGPQDPQQIREAYHELQQHFPQATAIASTLDAFALALEQVRGQLPVVTEEMGDTWIHGAGTDPAKESRYRALLRLRQSWIARGIPAELLKGFSRKLLCVPEHTWGLDVKTHLADWEHYSASAFQAARSGENYRKMEASWQEQRDYLTQAVAALNDAELREEAEDCLAELIPVLPDQSRYEAIKNLGGTFETKHFRVSFDPQGGWINALQEWETGKQWAGPENPLGKFWHQTFSAADYERFYEQYIQNKEQTKDWSRPDFMKPGLEQAAPESRTFLPVVTWAGQCQEADGQRFLLLYSLPEESSKQYGGPRQAALEIKFPDADAVVQFELQWFDKPACRMPEALWFSFVPNVGQPEAWRLNKLGEWIAPHEVIRDGNRHLHAIWQGARWKGNGETLAIESLDTALVAPGQPSLLNFTNEQPDLSQGVHYNLFNNLWGTNFPMWYEDDGKFRFVLRL